MSAINLLEFTEADRIEIYRQLGKTTKTVEEDAKKLQEWVKKLPHLPEIPDLKVIERYLLLNKLRVEDTKTKLDLYYTVRSLIPDFYDKTPKDLDMQKAYESFYFFPFPKLTKQLNRIVYTKVRDPDSSKFDATCYIIHTLQIGEIRLREDYSLSQVFVYDCNGVKINHIAKFTPSLMKKSAFIVEKVFSSRAQGIHFVNVPSAVDSFVSLLKSILKPKLANRVFIHRNYDSLFKIVEKDVFPKDLGGGQGWTLEDLHGAWKKKMMENQELFEHLCNLKTNENLRPEKRPYDDYFGLEGNFRKLEVD